MDSTQDQKMKVEIWSDVMCPFCYIGKRKFEKGLEGFAHNDKVEVVWKSFQLDPTLKTDASVSINQMLAEKKGWSLKQAQEANDYVTGIASEVGLTYHLDKAVVANSFDAHRLSHLAKKHNRQDQLEERLFAAYFTEGKNTGDKKTLVQIGSDAGLAEKEVRHILDSPEYGDAVESDIARAAQVGVRGVPFFVLGNKYAVSGAQDPATFTQALDMAWGEWSKENAAPQLLSDGAACGPDGCD